MIPTCAVTCTMYDQNGDPEEGAVVRAKLNRYEVYEGYVVPEMVTGICDQFGQCILNLWPNELGATASLYEITLVGEKGRKLQTQAAVPNLPEADLHTISLIPPYPGKSDGQISLEEAHKAATEAKAAAKAAEESEIAAKASEDAAKVSEDNAKISEDNAKASEIAAKASEEAAQGSQQNEDNAKESADAAKASEIAAKASEDAAKASEDAAQVSEDNAWRSKTEANQSALDAQIAEDSAIAAANNANASRVDAEQSAEEAAASAAAAEITKEETQAISDALNSSLGDASDSAAAAAQSAVESAASAAASANSAFASKNSADNSESSAVNSQKSAQEAKASENAAKNSENAAAGHSSSAKNHADAAKVSADNAKVSENAAFNSALQAESVYDQFDDRYLGPHANDPTTDNDGDPLVIGAMYFNTTNDTTMIYGSSGWQAASSSIAGIKADFIYTAAGGQTVFSGESNDGQSLVMDQEVLVNVFLNGVRLIGGADYDVDTTLDKVTLLAPCTVGDNVEIEVFGNFASQSGSEINIIGGSISGIDSLSVEGKTTTETLEVGDGVTIDAILDEDDMVSDSDTAVPTQQSVKAYVDTSLEAYSPTSEAISTNSFPNVDGVQTTFSLARAPVNEDNCQVYFSGVYQSKSNFSVVGSNITFSTAPPKGTDVEIMIVYSVTVDEDSKGGSLFKGNNGTVGSPSGLSDIFRVNANSLNTNVTIDADENASCTGPLAIADGVIVTVGGNLTVV